MALIMPKNTCCQKNFSVKKVIFTTFAPMKLRFVLIIGCWISCWGVFSQTLPHNKKAQDAFDKGKDFYGAKKYKEAIEKFTESASRVPQHNYTIVSYLYVGLSFYHQKQYESALTNFERVLSLKPFGKYHQEANYHKALCLVENGRLSQGLDLLANIYSFRSPYVMASAENAFIHHLKDKGNYDFWDSYYKNFSVDKADYLKTKILECLLVEDAKNKNTTAMRQHLTKLSEEDNKSSIVQSCKQYLVDLAKVNKNPNNPTGTIVKENDGKLLVSILLPLNVSEDEPSRNTNFPRHFWYGVYLAYQEYKEANPNANVFINVVDIPKDSTKLNAIFDKSPYLAASDIIIGAYTNAAATTTAQYAQKIGAVYVNPIGYNTKLFKNMVTSLLSNASYETHGTTLANYIFKDTPDRTIAIVHEPNDEMKQLANSFSETFTKAGGKTILIPTGDNMGYNVVQAIREKKAEGIYFCSDNAIIFNALVSTLNQNAIFTKLYSYPECRRFETTSADMLDRFKIIFTDDSFVNMTEEKTIEFRKKYRGYTLSEPDEGAYRGYDLMTFILKTTKNFATTQPSTVTFEKAGTYQGLQTVYDYAEKKQDNQHLYILQYKDNELIKLK